MTDELTPPQTDTDGPTKAELLEHAAELEVEGRSSMTKLELAEAIRLAEAKAGGHIAVQTQGQDQAAAAVAGATPDPEPTPDDVVGRPPLTSLAEERAANRNPRVIGA